MLGSDHAFGEFIESCLAINLGYLALERFRYRDAIKRIVDTARSHLEGMPSDYRTDKAWEDLSNITKTPGPDSGSAFLHFAWQRIFSRGLDRGLAMAAAIASFATLAIRATGSSLDFLLTWFPWAIWILFFFLLITTASSAILIKIGRGCVHRVARIVWENVDHLAERYKQANKDAPEKMIEFVKELKQDHH